MSSFNGNSQFPPRLPLNGRLPIIQNLTDLADVNITSPSMGEALFYDPGSQKWVDDSVTGAGAVSAGQNIDIVELGLGVIATTDPFLVDNINELTPAAGISINHAVKVTNGLVEIGLPALTQGNLVLNNDGIIAEPNILFRGTVSDSNITGKLSGIDVTSLGQIELNSSLPLGNGILLKTTGLNGGVLIESSDTASIEALDNINLQGNKVNIFGFGVGTAIELTTDNGGIEINSESGGAASTVYITSDGTAPDAITLSTSNTGGILIETTGGIDIQGATDVSSGTSGLRHNTVPVVSTITNVGIGQGLIFKNRTGQSTNFRSLLSGTGITIINGTDEITISTSSASREILLGPESHLWNGNPIYVLSGILTEYGFGNNDTNNIVTGIVLPYDYTGGNDLTFTYYWHATPTTGNVKWDFEYGKQSPGLAVVTTGTTDTQTVAVSGTSNALVTSSFTIVGATLSGAPGDILSIKLSRNGTAGGDTLAGQCNLTYGKITYS